MRDCIFCKIINEELPTMKVFEDAYTLAFMDTAKDVDGHILVVPKKHICNILDCDSETLSHIMNTVKKISSDLVDKCGYSGVNLLNASDISAGQSVPHFHMHIIPRKNNDGINAWPNFTGAKHEIVDVYDSIKEKLLKVDRREYYLNVINTLQNKHTRSEIAWYFADILFDIIRREEFLSDFPDRKSFVKFLGVSNATVSQYYKAVEFDRKMHFDRKAYTLGKVYLLSTVGYENYNTFLLFCKDWNYDIEKMPNSALRNVTHEFREANK
jgi:histidine triad (HIT) family protein